MGRGVSSSSLSLNMSTPSYDMMGPMLKLYRSQGKVSPNRKVLLRGILLWYHHPLGGIDFLGRENFMIHDECVGLWTPPPYYPKILPYKNKSLHPLLMPFAWPLIPDEGVGVQHLGNFLGFGPMSGLEVHGSWHCFCWFSHFLWFYGVWIGLCHIIITLLSLWMKPVKTLPRSLYS